MPSTERQTMTIHDSVPTRSHGTRVNMNRKNCRTQPGSLSGTWIGRSATLLLLAVIFLGSVELVPAQALEIIKHQDLLFGTMLRENTKSVNYLSPEAGLYELHGASRQKVRISVVSYTPSLDVNQLILTILPRDIAFSRDGGITWTECKNATLSWTTQFPRTSGGVPSTILVRVGGTISSSSGQQRGEYRGTVRLTASYVN